MSVSQRWRQMKSSLLAAGAILAVLVLAVLVFDDGSTGSAPQAGPFEVPDPLEVYDPVRADEPLPDGYQQVLGRDMIHPVYEPSFVDATAVDWPESTDVIGVAGIEEAKAYPVSHLSFREMVIDDIEGIPILVSW